MAANRLHPVEIDHPAIRYTASQALDIARGYWPGARVFVSFSPLNGLGVGFMHDDDGRGPHAPQTAEEFHGRTFNDALALASPHRFPIDQRIAEA